MVAESVYVPACISLLIDTNDMTTDEHRDEYKGAHLSSIPMNSHTKYDLFHRLRRGMVRPTLNTHKETIMGPSGRQPR